MKPLLKIILFLAIGLAPHLAKAQETGASKQHAFIFNPNFFQVKDAFNYGLVYTGFNLSVGYEYEEITERAKLNYRANVAFGPDFGKGIGLNWQFQPFNLSYEFNVSNRSWQIYLGPYISANYIWDIYPFLQSGHMFWCATYEVGPRITATFPRRFSGLSASVSAMSFGLASRPKPATETHFYSMTLGDFFTNAHSNLKFGSLDLFDHLNLQIAYKNPRVKRFTLGYELDYLKYNNDPGFSYLSHSIILKWKIGKS